MLHVAAILRKGSATPETSHPEALDKLSAIQNIAVNG